MEGEKLGEAVVQEERMSESEKDLVKEIWEHRDDPEEWGEEENIEVRPRRSSVVSFRLPPEEFAVLEQAVAQTGESLSEFIRSALALRLRGEPGRSGIEVTYGEPDYPDQIMVRSPNILIGPITKASYIPDAPTDRRYYRSTSPDKVLTYE
jgi:hypothetical protein